MFLSWLSLTYTCWSLDFVLELSRIRYLFLFHALKNTANQRPGLPLHILRYATGNMQRVLFLSRYFTVITCAQQFTGVFLRTSQKPAPKLLIPTNHYEHFWSRPEIFRWFLNTSEDFRRFSEHFKLTILNRFRIFPKIPEDCQTFSKIFLNRLSSSKTGLKRFRSFRKFPEISDIFGKFS